MKSPSDMVANMWDCNIIVTKFDHYYVNFTTNNLGNGINSLSLTIFCLPTIQQRNLFIHKRLIFEFLNNHLSCQINGYKD